MDDFEAHPAGMADLVKRLREKQICTGFEQVEPGVIDCVYGSDPVCQDAADRIEQLEAALTRANAATATAYEVAARAIMEKCHDDMDRKEEAAIVRALATPDQTAALDKLIAEAKAEGWREAAAHLREIISHAQHAGIYDDEAEAAINSYADYILAASKKGGV